MTLHSMRGARIGGLGPGLGLGQLSKFDSSIDKKNAHQPENLRESEDLSVKTGGKGPPQASPGRHLFNANHLWWFE